MYKMPEFTETDQQQVMDFIKAHPFVTLIGNDGVKSAATQVPVLIYQDGDVLKLRGHVMRKTDHQLAFEKNPEVLVLFTGPQCYVSASWYDERGIGSTWNYMTVHARGIIQMFNEKETVDIITELTHHHENGRQKPELVEFMHDDYVNTLVRAITGFEIIVQSMHPIFKLSQNRNEESYRSIVRHLNESIDAGPKEIADEMIKRRPELFAVKS
jgi:transcriptional regulator